MLLNQPHCKLGQSCASRHKKPHTKNQSNPHERQRELVFCTLLHEKISKKNIPTQTWEIGRGGTIYQA